MTPYEPTPGALVLTLVVAVVYLLTIRAIDLNEKEPTWAVGLLFVFGLTAGALLPLVVGSSMLEATTWQGALTKETAKLLAFSAAFAILLVVSRGRGWLEVSGIVDGIVYGATLGFGFATGLVATLYWTVPVSPAIGNSAILSLVIPIAVSGFSHGLFGALTGTGFGMTVDSESLVARVLYQLLGFLSAFTAHAAYLWVIRGDALGGTDALVRTWIGLTIPVAFLLAVFIYGISKERKAIAQELANELDVASEPLSFAARRVRRLISLATGNVGAYRTRRKVHNRQVMLALAKRRARFEEDSQRRRRIEEEIRCLRSSVLQLKQGAGGA